MRWKNTKGFTMVEMLAVFVILAVLAMIAVPAISSMIRKTSQEYYRTLEGNIKIAGENYFSDNRRARPKINLSTSDVSLEVLEENKYFNEKIVDASGNNTCSGYVRALKEKEGKYSYTTCLSCEGYQSKKDYCDTEGHKDYHPDNNENIYHLEAPETVYSYLGKEIDVNNIEKATLYARDKKIGTVTALASSVQNIDTSIEQVYSGQVVYQVEVVKDQMITAQSDLRIYEHEAPAVTLSHNGMAYLENTWTNQDVVAKIEVKDYEYGKFKELQYLDEATNKWKMLDQSKRHTSEFNCNQGKECEKVLQVRSMDTKGNVSRVGKKVIRIDKLAPDCPSIVYTQQEKTWINDTARLAVTPSSDTSKWIWYTRNNTNVWNEFETYTDNTLQNKELIAEGKRQGKIKVLDALGNSRECLTKEFWVDKTKPSCSLAYTGLSGNNGWYKGYGDINLTTSDSGGSGVKSYSLNNQSQITKIYHGYDTNGANYYGSVTDGAGNVENCSINIKVDTQLPTLTISRCTVDKNIINSMGANWNRNYAVFWATSTDSGSGFASMKYRHCYQHINGKSGDAAGGAASMTCAKKSLDVRGFSGAISNSDYPLGFNIKGNSEVLMQFQVVDNAGNITYFTRSLYWNTNNPQCSYW